MADRLTDETAKELAAAMSRLAAAIEAVSAKDSLFRGIEVRHYGNPYQQVQQQPYSGFRCGDPVPGFVR